MIGDVNISILTNKSSKLAYEFYNSVADKKHKNLLFLGFPRKDNISLLLGIDILSQLLKNDLHNAKVNSHLRMLKPGDKIVFFGKIRAEFISYSDKYIHFYSKGYEYFGNRRMSSKERHYLPLIYGNYLRKYNGTAKTYHLLTDILKAASERRGKVRAKEKLFLDDNSSRRLGVPSGLLKSKVLLVTGNGNKKKFDKLTEKINIYEKSVKSIFGENLIIKKSLKKYEKIFSVVATSERLNYDKNAKDLLWKLIDNYPKLEDEFRSLIIEFEKGNYNKQSLLDLKEDIKILYNEEPSVFDALIGRLPQNSITLPTNLKLVIINSFEMVENYQHVIKGFIERGIKVISIYDFSDISYPYSNTFSNSPKYFWNRQKIRSLIKKVKENSNDIIDKKFWNIALAYSRRKYNVSLYDDDGIAEVYWKLYRNIKIIDGKEKLVELFWTKIHPFYYLIKNSPNLEETIKLNYLNQISSDLEEILTNDSGVKKLFLEFIKKTERYKNSKIMDGGQVFSQEINFGSEPLIIPNNRDINSITFQRNIKPKLKKFIISGIPFKNHQLKLIDDLIKSSNTEELNFLCWPNEFTYLKKLIQNFEKSQWLKDNLITEIAENTNCPLEVDNREIINVTNFCKEILEPEEMDFEEEAYKQSTYYHLKFKGKTGAYTKKSLTIFLKSNKWIYIPLNDNIYYFNHIENTIKQKKGSEFNKSDTLVLFNISKEDIRNISSSNDNMDQVVKDLEIWSDALEMLYNKSNKCYYNLEQRLRLYVTEARPKANPNRINLMRWLDDNDLTLAPRKDHLGIILEAAGLYHEKPKVITANKKIRRYEKKFKKNIKKEVFRRADEFKVKEDEIITKEILVDGVSVEITTCKVLSIDKERLDIDNRYVKQIV